MTRKLRARVSVARLRKFSRDSLLLGNNRDHIANLFWLVSFITVRLALRKKLARDLDLLSIVQTLSVWTLCGPNPKFCVRSWAVKSTSTVYVHNVVLPQGRRARAGPSLWEKALCTPYSMNSLFSEFFNKIGQSLLEVFETIWGIFWEVPNVTTKENKRRKSGEL